MSTAGDVLGIVKKIFLISDEMARMSKDVDRLAHKVEDHEGRLIRLETTLALVGKQNRKVLPGT